MSLRVVVESLLNVPIAGSVYLFSATALGILLGTVARSIPQLGLFFMMVALPMNLLSGGDTPLDSMPPALQQIMQFVPSTHYVSFSQAILYRGAGFDVVWRSFAAIVCIGSVFFIIALMRFRKTVVLT